MEARGLGIMSVPAAPQEVPLSLVVRSTPHEAVPRIPESLESEWLDLTVATIGIDLLEASAPAKVRLALVKLARSIIPPS